MPIATPPAERAGGGSGAARLLLAGLMLAYALAALASGMERMAAQRAGPPADLATARAGFSAQPLSALAAGALAAAEWRAGNGAMAERVFRHAAQLGWREPVTQLYWLQVAAAAGEWDNAAKRYDALLRVDPRRAALAELAAQVEGAGAGRASLARRIALRPHWLADYADPPGPLAESALLARAAVLREADARGALDCGVAARLGRRLVGAGLAQAVDGTWRAKDGTVMLALPPGCALPG